jgi:hypothetical protein
LGEALTHNWYKSKYGDIKYRTISFGKAGDLAGKIEVTFPADAFIVPEESVTPILMLIKDFAGLVFSNPSFAEIALPFIIAMMQDLANSIMENYIENMEDPRAIIEDQWQNPPLN